MPAAVPGKCLLCQGLQASPSKAVGGASGPRADSLPLGGKEKEPLRGYLLLPAGLGAKVQEGADKATRGMMGSQQKGQEETTVPLSGLSGSKRPFCSGQKAEAPPSLNKNTRGLAEGTASWFCWGKGPRSLGFSSWNPQELLDSFKGIQGSDSKLENGTWDSHGASRQ